MKKNLVAIQEKKISNIIATFASSMVIKWLFYFGLDWIRSLNDSDTLNQIEIQKCNPCIGGGLSKMVIQPFLINNYYITNKYCQ